MPPPKATLTGSTPLSPTQHRPSPHNSTPKQSTSTSRQTKPPVLHLHTAAAGGCPQGTSICVSKSTSIVPTGSRYIDENLLTLMARNNPQVKKPVVTCPAARSYPVNCKLSGQASIHGHLVAVKGTLSVLGVEVRMRTYAYSLLYRPVHG